jgi:hypothetical protein
MKLRQVALAAAQLEPIRSKLMALLGLDADFADPGVAEFGLRNTVLPIGDTFLEVVAPTRPDTAAGRTLAMRGEDPCGYMVLLQVNDFATFASRLEPLGLRTVWQTNRPDVSAAHVHPKDIGGAIVSFDQMRPPEAWVWGGPAWQSRRARHANGITGCVIGAREPGQMLARWSAVLDVTPAGNRLNLDAGTFVEFVHAGRKEGVQTIIIECSEPDRLNAEAARSGLADAIRFVSAGTH